MDSLFQIRLFRLSDMEGVERIEAACFAADAYDRNLFAEFYHKCGGLFLVAVGGRDICGYAITCKRGASGSAEVVSIAVQPEMRGKGVASALMESTLRRLRRRGIGRLSLMVRTGNRAALRFYGKYGFRRVRLVRKYYERGQDGILMARQV